MHALNLTQSNIAAGSAATTTRLSDCHRFHVHHVYDRADRPMHRLETPSHDNFDVADSEDDQLPRMAITPPSR